MSQDQLPPHAPVPCAACLSQGPREPHARLARVHRPSGVGWAVYSCTLCSAVFIQEINGQEHGPLQLCTPRAGRPERG